jgi:hypothetical protein
MQPHPDTSPNVATADNRSLHLGLQQSEGRRLSLLMVVLAATLGFTVLRHELGGLAMGGQKLFVTVLVLWAVVAGYAVLLGVLVRHANQRGLLLPTWLWGLTTVLESLVPTAALLMLQEFSPLDPLELLTAPVILLYGVFIVVSILRLRPWLSLLAGVVCAAAMRLSSCIWPCVPEKPSRSAISYYLSYPVYLLLPARLPRR